MADRVEIALDAGSRIPDPPLADEDILRWARDLTEKLRNDHSDTVGRVEHMVMSDRRTTKRPEAKGTNRMFYDEYDEIFYLDSLDRNKNPQWKPINAFENWSAEDLGVHVLYSTSLPVAGLSSGYFTWDEEAWDEDSYWPGSGNVITVPETRVDSRAYQVEIFAEITALSSESEILVSATIGGSDLTWLTEGHAIWRSDGTTHKIRINFIRPMIEGDELQVGYSADSTFTLNEQYVIVTPVTLEVGGGGVIPTISDHGELSGLGDDDHALYLLASDATNRATFASYWTDLTDGGETSLHSHAAADLSPLYLDNNDSIFWDTAAVGTAYVSLLYFNASNRFEVGDDSYDLLLSGDDITLSSEGTLYLGTVGNAITCLAEIGAGYGIDVGTYGVSASGNLMLDYAAGWLELGGGATGGIQNTAGEFRLLPYGSSVRMQWSGGTWAEYISIDATDKLSIGYSTKDTHIVGNDITSQSLSATFLATNGNATLKTTGAASDVVLDSSDKTYITSVDDVVFTCPIVDMSAGGKVRVPYLGAAPSGLANGDVWMESDGLHIYYGGAEYTVAGV